MKAKLTVICAGICSGVMLAMAANADDIGTRSTADANADLMRTYQSPGGPPASTLMSRSSTDSYTDMMRDWDGSLTQGQGTIVGAGDTAGPTVTGGHRSLTAAGFGRR